MDRIYRNSAHTPSALSSFQSFFLSALNRRDIQVELIVRSSIERANHFCKYVMTGEHCPIGNTLRESAGHVRVEVMTRVIITKRR